MIYTEGFGAELVRAEPVLLDVGFTVGSMRRKMSAIDYAQVFAADTAANEVDANTTSVLAEFWIPSSFKAMRRFTVAGGVKSRLHRVAQVYMPGAL